MNATGCWFCRRVLALRAPGAAAICCRNTAGSRRIVFAVVPGGRALLVGGSTTLTHAQRVAGPGGVGAGVDDLVCAAPAQSPGSNMRVADSGPSRCAAAGYFSGRGKADCAQRVEHRWRWRGGTAGSPPPDGVASCLRLERRCSWPAFPQLGAWGDAGCDPPMGGRRPGR